MSPRRTTRRPAADPIITLLTDFGGRDGYVGIMKGVILGIAPRARLVDLAHDVGAQDVRVGALVLESAVGHFPRGTVHLAVIDPGVGGARRAVAVETEDFVLVGPDNGLLAPAAARSKRRTIVALDVDVLGLGGLSRTFHGRDLFAPVAARIAAGEPASACGSPIESLEPLTLPEPRVVEGVVEGHVLHVDRFGNLVLDVRAPDLAGFRGGDLSVTIGGVEIHGVSSNYGAVREKRPVVVWNSWGRLEVAIRNGSAARQLRVAVGDRVEVRRAPGR